MDGNGALFGTLQGNTREVLHKFTVDLPKKHGEPGCPETLCILVKFSFLCFMVDSSCFSNTVFKNIFSSVALLTVNCRSFVPGGNQQHVCSITKLVFEKTKDY